VLTPDFKGKRWCVRMVVEARPDIYNHNIETVARLSPMVRPQAKYERTLDVLRAVKNMDASIHTKSGIMLGLGETHDEVVQTLSDLREAGVSAVTIGQYLRPTTTKHLPVVSYITPERFQEYERLGERMGFLFVASGPFVRSSYNAQAFSENLLADRLARVGQPVPA
jgi:lipoic acid synthetase